MCTWVLLSTLILQEKTDYEPVLPARLFEACASLKQLVMTVGEIQLACGLDISADDYFRPAPQFGLVEVLLLAKLSLLLTNASLPVIFF